MLGLSLHFKFGIDVAVLCLLIYVLRVVVPVVFGDGARIVDLVVVFVHAHGCFFTANVSTGHQFNDLSLLGWKSPYSLDSYP